MVRFCTGDHGVDFWFQCADFLRQNGLDEHLYRRYVETNRYMREAGVEAYYEEIKALPGIREEKGGNASRFPVGERLVLLSSIPRGPGNRMMLTLLRSGV